MSHFRPMSHDETQRLYGNARRRSRIRHIGKLIAALVALGTLAAAYYYTHYTEAGLAIPRRWSSLDPHRGNGFYIKDLLADTNLLIIVLAGVWTAMLLEWMVGMLARKVAPPFLIDRGDDGIVRVYGNLGEDDRYTAVTRALKRNPGYEVCEPGDAHTRFGCDTALLPAGWTPQEGSRRGEHLHADYKPAPRIAIDRIATGAQGIARFEGRWSQVASTLGLATMAGVVYYLFFSERGRTQPRMTIDIEALSFMGEKLSVPWPVADIVFWALVAGLVVAWTGIFILKRFLRGKWYAPYYIDASEDSIIRIYGDTRGSNGRRAVREAKNIRQDYTRYKGDDTLERYGCSVALVPVPQRH